MLFQYNCKDTDLVYNYFSLSGIHPAVIAGIASRESGAGKYLYRTNGWGDFRNGTYHAYGIMQVYFFVYEINILI